MSLRFLGLAASAATLAAILVPQASAQYYAPWQTTSRPSSYIELPWTDALTQVKHYGRKEGLRYSSREEFAIRTSPYTSVTHALHPVYRHNYFGGSTYTGRRISRPEFNRYLSDLYYSGALDQVIANQQQNNAFANCYNYSTLRLAQRTPEWMTHCN